MVDATDGRGADVTTSCPISGWRSQIVCKTLLSESASRVSRRRGKASGRPMTSLFLVFFDGRAIWRDDMAGDVRGETDMSSSRDRGSRSSSAFRLRADILGERWVAIS